MLRLSTQTGTDALHLRQNLTDFKRRACPSERLQFVQSTTRVPQPTPGHLGNKHPRCGQDWNHGKCRLVAYPAGAMLIDAGARYRREIEGLAGCNHGRRQRERFSLSQTMPDDRHQPGTHLIIWNSALSIICDKKFNFFVRVRLAESLFTKNIDDTHSFILLLLHVRVS